MREASGLRRRAVRQRDNVPSVIGPDAELEQLLSLLEAPAAQFLDSERWQRQGARSPAFRLFLPDIARVGLLGAGDHRQLPDVQIDPLPAQGGDLAAANAAEH